MVSLASLFTLQLRAAGSQVCCWSPRQRGRALAPGHPRGSCALLSPTAPPGPAAGRGNAGLQPSRQPWARPPSLWGSDGTRPLMARCKLQLGLAEVVADQTAPPAAGSSGAFPMGRACKPHQRSGAGDVGQDRVIFLGEASTEQPHPAPACCWGVRKRMGLAPLFQKSRAHGPVPRQVAARLHPWQILDFPGQTGAAQLSQHTTRPGSRIKATVSAASRASREERQQAAAAGLASSNRVPSSQPEDRGCVLQPGINYPEWNLIYVVVSQRLLLCSWVFLVPRGFAGSYGRGHFSGSQQQHLLHQGVPRHPNSPEDAAPQ